MKTEQFNEMARAFLDEAFERLTKKGEEYELTVPYVDRYAQLEQQAQLTGLEVEGVIDVLMAKHITVICNLNKSIHLPEFKERALDVIAYLCLIYGLYEEAEL